MLDNKLKQKRPPLYPHKSKASKIGITISKERKMNSLKKNQRLTQNELTRESSPSISPQCSPPLPTRRLHTVATEQENATDNREIQQKEYQLFNRKSYLRNNRKKVDSDLTNKQSPIEQCTDHVQKSKSKSALQYAKYFIKQNSNGPTEPSSR